MGRHSDIGIDRRDRSAGNFWLIHWKISDEMIRRLRGKSMEGLEYEEIGKILKICKEGLSVLQQAGFGNLQDMGMEEQGTVMKFETPLKAIKSGDGNAADT